MTKITVVVPIYNSDRFLERCIRSVINQTFQDIEVLLINDGSNDKSGQICDKYAEKDSRITVYHKKNQGVSSARNLAIDKAKGEYICFVDSDDEIDKCMLEELHKLINNNNADIVICGHKSIYPNNKVVDRLH